MPASCPRASGRAFCERRRPAWRRSPRLTLCGETSRDQLGELRVAVVAGDVERGAPAPSTLLEVHALAGDEELDRELIVALHRVEELAVVVVLESHGRQFLARLQAAISGDRIHRRGRRLDGEIGELAADREHAIALLGRHLGGGAGEKAGGGLVRLVIAAGKE